MITKSVIFSGLTVAVLAASSFTTVALAGSKGAKARPWVDVVLHVKLDAKGSAAKLGPFDPFSDGTRTGAPDPHVDMAKRKVLDTFGAGFDMRSTGRDSPSNGLT
ncbi:hypothetical protein [Cupriavidus basilensis]|uniref:Uncharacterized protein n=1 Tax=Cupriavidus basilensis TaxID=68895 RepID=A0A0C4YJW5_9BURK|nr:hypothetical protein [Cupriavidus basilensis]AJG23373.1 hypothetical protein RR42_s1785 [Cupriavidus basilensis]